MANLTSEDVRKLIEASSWKHPYSEHGNDFILPVSNPAFTDLGVRWTAFIKLIDAEGDKAQRLVILSSTDSVPDGLRQEAYEFCNKWANECSYVRTWFSEEHGKVYISASVESPGDLPEKWLIDSFVNQSLEIIKKFWAESFLKLTELDKLKASQKARAEAAPESGSAPQEVVRKAAEQGDAEAQFKLGELYRQGIGVTQDFAETAKWYRKAAEQGHAAAQCNLGVCYAKGDGVEEDIEEAMNWFRKAADQGNVVAEKYYCMLEVRQFKKMMSGAISSEDSQLDTEDSQLDTEDIVLAEKTRWKGKIGWACVVALILVLIVVRIIMKS